MISLAIFGTSSALALALMTSASAQTTTVERTAKGPAAANIRVGLYLNVKPDCTSGPLPAIRLLAPPANGTLTIKRGNVTATNYKQCLALEVPGFVAFYKSKPDFAGIDSATIEVKYPAGRTEIQRISITVGSGKGGQKI
ncbi:hypothetical protein [Nitrobacter sp.]|uniref:hypothetical protein n=1 Tax=Nitrobacter sp. TaxID=29420 RepID=UPI003F653BE1